MFLKRSTFLLLASLSSQVFAFQCYITLVKDSCWTNYSVKINVINTADSKVIASVEAEKGKHWARQPFNCDPGMRLTYNASFHPTFWQSGEGKIYQAIRYWILPNKIGANESAWDIPVCFSSAFAEVPFPPDATSTCKCDLFDVPPVTPAKAKS